MTPNMKEHPRFKNYYITEDGNVYSTAKNYKTPKKLSLMPHPKYDYVYVSCGRYGKQRVHRLVAETYIPNPNNLPEVNHLDEDKLNNHLSNLEWCDRQRNAEYSVSKTYLVKNIHTGEVHRVFNLNKFCKENNLSPGSLWMTETCRKQHKGWKIVGRVTQ